jgi:hypothetical protein
MGIPASHRPAAGRQPVARRLQVQSPAGRRFEEGRSDPSSTRIRPSGQRKWPVAHSTPSRANLSDSHTACSEPRRQREGCAVLRARAVVRRRADDERRRAARAARREREILPDSMGWIGRGLGLAVWIHGGRVAATFEGDGSVLLALLRARRRSLQPATAIDRNLPAPRALALRIRPELPRNGLGRLPLADRLGLGGLRLGRKRGCGRQVSQTPRALPPGPTPARSSSSRAEFGAAQALGALAFPRKLWGWGKHLRPGGVSPAHREHETAGLPRSSPAPSRPRRPRAPRPALPPCLAPPASTTACARQAR